MKAIRDIARELKLNRVSVREHCKTRGIVLHRRLPRGADGGQTEAFVTTADARRIGAHYACRLENLSG